MFLNNLNMKCMDLVVTSKIFINSDDDEIIQKNNEINECVICLEPVKNVSEISKFGCIHSKYMHDDCVKNLSKCPLCRESSNIIENNNNSLQFTWKERLFFFGVGCFFSIILFIASYPMIIFRFIDNDSMSNSTNHNYTIDNYTIDNYTLDNINYRMI